MRVFILLYFYKKLEAMTYIIDKNTTNEELQNFLKKCPTKESR